MVPSTGSFSHNDGVFAGDDGVFAGEVTCLLTCEISLSQPPFIQKAIVYLMVSKA